MSGTGRPPVSLVVLTHGSANPAGIRTVEAVVARVRYRLPGVRVQPAYVEVAHPSLTEALSAVPGPVVVVPLLCASEHAEVRGPDQDRSHVADALGPERLVAQALVRRLLAAGARRGEPVALLAAGSTGLAAQGELARAAHVLGQAWAGPVASAHLTGRGPRLSQAVSGLRRRHGVAPAVAPYLLARGQHHDRVRDASRGLGLEVVADVVGDDPHLAEAVARRYRAAAARRFALSLG